MTKTPSSLQDLSKSLYDKAKAEPTKRFWGLYVHVCKKETLQEAYRMAKKNNGAPGIDGVTFEAIEESGAESFLQQIRDELTTNTYRPMRVRKKEVPKDGGKVRVLSIPSIRDRVVQGALKLILEPIFEADFQPGSYGYRPKRTAHEAVSRVAEAIVTEKTKIIDLDLRAYFDNVQHYLVLEKVAKRVQDDAVMRLLKMILKATGKKGVPQGGVVSPLLSNLYLNEVDRMLEKAIDTTRNGKYTYLQYVRFADDLVILIDSYSRHAWLVKAVEKRLREELAKLSVEINEEKSRMVDLRKQGSFGFLGFDFRRIRVLKGLAAAVHAKAEEANGGAGEAPGHFPATCEPTCGAGDRDDQPNSSRVGELLRGRAFRQMFHVYQRLGRKDDTETSDVCAETPGIRLEAME